MPRPELVAGALERLQSAELSVFPYRCAVIRNRNASCMRCAQACTSGAISVGEDEIVIDPERCVGCGTCATVCPTCALEARHPGDAELALRVRRALEATGDTLVIACDALWRRNARRIDPERAVRVTCLGRVDESVLVEAAARGARRLLLAHASCECCPRSAGQATYLEVMDTANLLLEAWGSPVRAELREKLPVCVRLEGASAVGPAYDEGRRDLFARVGQAAGIGVGAGDAPAGDVPAAAGGDRAIEGDAPAPAGSPALAGDPAPAGGPAAAGDPAPAGSGPEGAPGESVPAVPAAAPDVPTRPLKVMLDGTLPHFLPDRRERLLDALATLGDPCEATLETRLWGRVEVDVARCKTCLMCATFCPTGAIAKVVGPEGRVTLEHRPADCVKCRCCTDVCPTGALTLREDVMAVEVAQGAVAERFELPPVRDGRGGPHSMIGALKKIIRFDQLYER